MRFLRICEKLINSKFNLKCKTLKKDTCNKCKIHAAKSLGKKQAEAEKTRHLERAENLRNHMNRDFQEPQNLPSVQFFNLLFRKDNTITPHIDECGIL